MRLKWHDTAPRKNVAIADRFRLWCGKMVDILDEIKNLQVAASLGSKSAAARLQAIEEDDAGQPDAVRSAAQKARHYAKGAAYIYGFSKEE